MGTGPAFVATWALTVAGLCAAALRVDAGAPTDTARDLALCFLPYSLLLWASQRHGGTPRHALSWALAGALLPGACMVASPSVLSDDLYRYLWDGRMWLAGIDAYGFPPDDPALAAFRDGHFRRINHPNIPTLYPPLAQALFAAATALWAQPAVFKAVGLVLHLLTVALAGRLARSIGGRGELAALLVALNPLCLSEAALGGHVDAAVGTCMLALALAMGSGRSGWAMALAAAGSGLKLVGIFLAPLLWRMRPRGLATVGVLLLSLLCVLPPMHAGQLSADAAPGLAHYTLRWRGNEGPFNALEAVARPLAGWLASEVGGHGRSSLGPQELSFDWLRTPRSGRADAHPGHTVLTEAHKEARPPGVYDRNRVVFLLARAIGGLLILGASLLCLRRRVAPASAIRAVLWTLLLTSPQIHPWYLLWLVPLDTALGGRSALIWSATVLAAYAPLSLWTQERIWHESPHTGWLQYGPVALALLFEHCAPATTKADPGSTLTPASGSD